MTITVGGVEMNSPIILGAGVCKNAGMIDPFNRDDLPLGALISGSYTPSRSEGNSPQPLSHWSEERHSGFNSYGMPNDGFKEGCRKLSEMQLVHPHVVSVAGFGPQDYVDAIKAFRRAYARGEIAALELNFGCPNRHEDKTVPLSYDLDSLEQTLHESQWSYFESPPNYRMPIWIKLSPYILQEDAEMLAKHGIDTSFVPVVDKSFIAWVARIIAVYRTFVRAAVSCNTIPNCRLLGEGGKFVTGPNDGKAGLSGDLLWQIALRQVRTLRALLPLEIDMIHSGGVLNGDRVVEALDNGAKAAQLTSLPYWFGPKDIADLLQSEALQQRLLSLEE